MEREDSTFNDNLEWLVLYLYVRSSGVADALADRDYCSPDASVFSLPTFALLLGRPDNGRPIFLMGQDLKGDKTVLKDHFFRF